MNLENTLNETSQIQKNTYCMIYQYEVPRVSKLIETENKIDVTRVLGKREWEVTVTKFQYEKMVVMMAEQYGFT